MWTESQGWEFSSQFDLTHNITECLAPIVYIIQVQHAGLQAKHKWNSARWNGDGSTADADFDAHFVVSVGAWLENLI